MSYFFGNIGNVGLLGIYLYGIFIFVSIFSYTELMDKNRYAWIFETIRFSFGALLIYQFGNWFGIDELIPFGTQIVTFFFILSLLGSFYFTQVEFKNNASFQAIRDKYT